MSRHRGVSAVLTPLPRNAPSEVITWHDLAASLHCVRYGTTSLRRERREKQINRVIAIDGGKVKKWYYTPENRILRPPLTLSTFDFIRAQFRRRRKYRSHLSYVRVTWPECVLIILKKNKFDQNHDFAEMWIISTGLFAVRISTFNIF